MNWRCKVCNFIHEGEEPPLECPVCHVGSYAFERISKTAAEGKTKDTSPGQVSNKLLDGILKQAITKEKETYNMYLNASRIVNDAPANKLINKLVEEESKHVSWLENLYISRMKIKDLNTKKSLDGLGTKAAQAAFNENTTLQDVIDIAKQREQWAYEFYSSMAKFVDQKEVKELFDTFANAELGHKHEIEKFSM